MFFFSKVFNSKIALFYNISIFTIAFFVFFALLFNNPLDPSFSVATGKIASNVFKNPGSYISDILLQNFGLSSYLIPIFMFLRIIFHSKIKRISLASFSLIFSIILVFSAILADFSDYFSSLSYPLGGFLGMLINSLFISISKSMIMILIIKFIILKILIFALLINDILDFKSFIKAHINYEKIFKKKNNKDFDEFSDNIFFNQINNESELSLIENNNIEDKKKNKLNINFLLKFFHVLQITKNYLLIVFKKIYFLIIKLFNLIKSLFAKKPINIRDFNLNIDHYTKPNILNYEFKSNNNLASRYNLGQKKEEDLEKNNIQKEDHNINELYKSDFFKNQGLLNENNNNNQLSDEISNTEFVANDQNNKILNTINNSLKENPFFIKEKNNTLMNNDLRKYKFPEISLLKEVNSEKEKVDMNFVLDLSNKLIKVLEDFSIFGKILDYSVGPVITLFEFEPLAGTKSSRIIGLSDDIARSLSAISARISVIPGKNALGIELPNQKREVVLLKELLDCDEYQNTKMTLPITLGKDISGAPIIVDLAKMPHVLVAGTTGSGKSVAINVFILSLLYKMKPQECRFIMIDPKMLELSIYNGIPHLLTPVVTDPKKAVLVLKWVVKEMESRYKIMSYLGVRNIQNYNQKIEDAVRDNQDLFKIINLGFDKGLDKPITEKIIIEKKKFHYIVVIVDEMADLMLVSGKEIEFYIQRIAQMARAAGIHIIMATQRPSVDVITGVIKANLPTRISFSVTNKIDSRTILGEQGAEQLLGMGDMLYMPSGGKILRIHGPFVSDKTVEAVVSYLTSLYPPMYLDEISNEIESNSVNSSSNGDSFDNPYDNEDADDKDERLYKQALRIVLNEKKTSISYIQRQLRIGYNKSANLIERMEKEGILSSPNHQGKREIIELGEDNE